MFYPAPFFGIFFSIPMNFYIKEYNLIKTSSIIYSQEFFKGNTLFYKNYKHETNNRLFLSYFLPPYSLLIVH